MAFKLEPNPTFKYPVNIPIPGEKADKVQFTFRHKTSTQIEDYQKGINSGEKSLKDIAREIVVEWNYPGVDYSEATLETCMEMFPGSPLAIWMAFREALFVAKEKN